MAALAVDQDQRMVWGQVAQHHRPDNRGRIADRLGVDVERRDHRAELILQVEGPLPGEVGGREHVNRHRRRGHRPRLRAGADDDRFLGKTGQQVLDLLGRQPERLDLVRRHPERAAERLDRLLRFVLCRAAGVGRDGRPEQRQYGQRRNTARRQISRLQRSWLQRTLPFCVCPCGALTGYGIAPIGLVCRSCFVVPEPHHCALSAFHEESLRAEPHNDEPPAHERRTLPSGRFARNSTARSGIP